jgi:hypothetical protein
VNPPADPDLAAELMALELALVRRDAEAIPTQVLAKTLPNGRATRV